ncbi:hypothetical protein ACC846_38145, partial [Rhizobium ruizarguesonis]
HGDFPAISAGAGWQSAQPAEAIARRARTLVPQIADAVHPDNLDFAVFTSGNPDFATRRLMQGFGISTR